MRKEGQGPKSEEPSSTIFKSFAQEKAQPWRKPERVFHFHDQI